MESRGRTHTAGALQTVNFDGSFSRETKEDLVGLTIRFLCEQITCRSERVYRTSTVAQREVLAFSAIFLFHEAHRAVQELFPYGAVHYVVHVPARENVPEQEVRKGAHEAFALSHIALGADTEEGMCAVLPPRAAEIIPASPKVIYQFVKGADGNPFRPSPAHPEIEKV